MSLDVLDYMTTHNVTGVRGNHDQKVIEWRGWIDWVESHEEGAEWLTELEKKHLSVDGWKEYEKVKKKPKSDALRARRRGRDEHDGSRSERKCRLGSRRDHCAWNEGMRERENAAPSFSLSLRQ